MLHRRCVGYSLHAKIVGDINDVSIPSRSLWMKEDSANMGQYINVDLTQLYNGDLSIKERSVMNVDDVFLVLHRHWVMDTANFLDGRQRLQVAFLVLTIAYTASRPGTLVCVARNEKKSRGYAIGEDEDENENRGFGDNEQGKTSDDGTEYFHIEGRYLDFDGKDFGQASTALGISKFRGTMSTALDAVPLKYHPNEKDVRCELIDCGKRFLA
jgi:hypothetical protein